MQSTEIYGYSSTHPLEQRAIHVRVLLLSHNQCEPTCFLIGAACDALAQAHSLLGHNERAVEYSAQSVQVVEAVFGECSAEAAAEYEKHSDLLRHQLVYEYCTILYNVRVHCLPLCPIAISLCVNTQQFFIRSLLPNESGPAKFRENKRVQMKNFLEKTLRAFNLNYGTSILLALYFIFTVVRCILYHYIIRCRIVSKIIYCTVLFTFTVNCY